MLDDSALLVALRRHWDYTGQDEDVAHEIYHDDAVLEFPAVRRAVRGRGELPGVAAAVSRPRLAVPHPADHCIAPTSSWSRT